MTSLIKFLVDPLYSNDSIVGLNLKRLIDSFPNEDLSNVSIF